MGDMEFIRVCRSRIISSKRASALLLHGNGCRQPIGQAGHRHIEIALQLTLQRRILVEPRKTMTQQYAARGLPLNQRMKWSDIDSKCEGIPYMPSFPISPLSNYAPSIGIQRNETTVGNKRKELSLQARRECFRNQIDWLATRQQMLAIFAR